MFVEAAWLYVLIGMHLSPSQKSLIKSQAGRPPGNREVTFDERGNVVGVMKLNVHNLPTHKVSLILLTLCRVDCCRVSE